MGKHFEVHGRLLYRRRSHFLLYLWSQETTFLLQEENSRLELTVIVIAKCRSRKAKKAAGQLLLEVFQEKVGQTCQVSHRFWQFCSEVGGT